ncbi:hypothetical protein KUTeg_015966 [Tegillarca granosa]|uniref:Uncharacterized protein n=1 Tax=Tegillarca granosa TaxID=220873 RepID=A0ABQ9EJI7_TEGGR|nr:hypothetical protein KUTeg_015966 [Tegillarca granosa]
MKDMVNESKTKCRRDNLWQRMLVGDQAEEDGKRKKRSETEESKDGSLLDMVVKKPLFEIDKQLMPFYNLSFQWYKSLYKYLLTRYPETHRCFSSADGHIQYIVSENIPK